VSSPRLTPVNPETLAKPVGYSNGLKGTGEVLFVAGQIGWDKAGQLVSPDFVAQFVQALDNVLEVVWKAGGSPQDIGRMTVYVTSLQEYVDGRKAIGEAWRTRMGRHYPAMSAVQVAGLLEPGAKVEIEATALL
jgi:enamine deaminase RidA (YjgF/YER057c/UK114 family)